MDIQVLADVLGAEAALGRIQFVSGTHAIATALYAVLRPGDELLAVAGRWAPPTSMRMWCIIMSVTCAVSLICVMSVRCTMGVDCSIVSTRWYNASPSQLALFPTGNALVYHAHRYAV